MLVLTLVRRIEDLILMQMKILINTMQVITEKISMIPLLSNEESSRRRVLRTQSTIHFTTRHGFLTLNSYFSLSLSGLLFDLQAIMIASNILLVCLQAIIVAAQTPPGFTPAVKEPLQVSYGTNELTPAGKKVARAGTIHPFP